MWTVESSSNRWFFIIQWDIPVRYETNQKHVIKVLWTMLRFCVVDLWQCLSPKKSGKSERDGKRVVLLQGFAASCGDHRERVQWHGLVHFVQSSNTARDEQPCLCCLCLCCCHYHTPSCDSSQQKVYNCSLQNHSKTYIHTSDWALLTLDWFLLHVSLQIKSGSSTQFLHNIQNCASWGYRVKAFFHLTFTITTVIVKAL